MTKREPGRIRALRFEVWFPKGEGKPIRDKWHALASQVQEAVNCTWQSWLCWHVQRGTPATLRKFYAKLRQWHQTKDGAKPKLDIKPIDKKCAKFIYDQVAACCPDLNTSTRELARNITQGKITGGKSAKGNIPVWQAVLLCRQSIPSSTRAQPIPFTKKPEQTRLYPPDEHCQQWRISLRLDRVVPAGKTRGESTLDMIELRTNVRGIYGHVKIIRDILAGKAELLGSNLIWDDHKGKWFVLISFRQGAQQMPALEKSKAARFFPLRERPAALLMPDGYALNLMGQGGPVAYNRHKLLCERLSRNENYRYSQRAGRGHGRQRAINWKERFEDKWRHFCTSFNRDMAAQAIRAMIRQGIGNLIVYQPCGTKGDNRYLAWAGKLKDRHDASGWPWFQVVTFLKEAAENVGIEVTVIKCGEQRKEAA